MASSAPQSPARRDGTSYFDTSPDRPSPSKLLRINQLAMERAASLPPRRLSSPAKKKPQIRPRLNQYYTLDHAVSLFKSSKNIVVLTGAGISTSLGVPDFRSANGVYNLLVDSVYDDPQELFHIDNFKTDPEEFFKQAAKVFPKMQGLASTDDSSAPAAPKFSLTHAFVALLQAKDKLLTNYTQNIDGLEVVAGISTSKLIQCHGTLATATCMSCGKRRTARKYMHIVLAGNVPYCKCSLVENERPNPGKSRPRGRSGQKKTRKRKRDDFEDTDSETSNSKPTDFPKGLLKPDMTFFGEDIADTYAPRLQLDKAKVDLLVIIGTSLKVAPVNEMLLNIPPTVPQIWISKDRCQRDGVKVDIELLGECDLILEEIARRAGWEDPLGERLWRSSSRKTTLEEKPTFAARPPNEHSRDRVRGDRHEGPSTSPKRLRPNKQEDCNQSAVNGERPLQIRQKSNDSPSLTVKRTTEIIIKLNDEVRSPTELDTDEREAGEKMSTDRIRGEAELQPGNEGAATMKDIPLTTAKLHNGTINGAKKEVVKSRTVQPRFSPSKVVVELEEGTRNRWYIRRTKADLRGAGLRL